MKLSPAGVAGVLALVVLATSRAWASEPGPVSDEEDDGDGVGLDPSDRVVGEYDGDADPEDWAPSDAAPQGPAAAMLDGADPETVDATVSGGSYVDGVLLDPSAIGERGPALVTRWSGPGAPDARVALVYAYPWHNVYAYVWLPVSTYARDAAIPGTPGGRWRDPRRLAEAAGLTPQGLDTFVRSRAYHERLPPDWQPKAATNTSFGRVDFPFSLAWGVALAALPFLPEAELRQLARDPVNYARSPAFERALTLSRVTGWMLQRSFPAARGGQSGYLWVRKAHGSNTRAPTAAEIAAGYAPGTRIFDPSGVVRRRVPRPSDVTTERVLARYGVTWRPGKEGAIAVPTTGPGAGVISTRQRTMATLGGATRRQAGYTTTGGVRPADRTEQTAQNQESDAYLDTLGKWGRPGVTVG